MANSNLRICETCGKEIPPKAKGKRFCSRNCIRLNEPIEIRFWKMVDVKEPDECWPWIRARDPAGYGVLTYNYKRYTASRLAYAFTKGPIPQGLYICHSCDNPPCCNPAHLWAGTPYDNSVDMYQKGRSTPPRKLGESHGNAKFTEDDVRAIRNDKRPLDVICSEYRISKSHASRLKNRKSWTHIK